MCKRRRKGNRESTMVITKVPGDVSKCVSESRYEMEL